MRNERIEVKNHHINDIKFSITNLTFGWRSKRKIVHAEKPLYCKLFIHDAKNEWFFSMSLYITNQNTGYNNQGFFGVQRSINVRFYTTFTLMDNAHTQRWSSHFLIDIIVVPEEIFSDRFNHDSKKMLLQTSQTLNQFEQ